MNSMNNIYYNIAEWLLEEREKKNHPVKDFLIHTSGPLVLGGLSANYVPTAIRELFQGTDRMPIGNTTASAWGNLVGTIGGFSLLFADIGLTVDQFVKGNSELLYSKLLTNAISLGYETGRSYNPLIKDDAKDLNVESTE